MWGRNLKEYCEIALEIFANKYQRCGYTFSDDTPCIARKKTHDQHCNERGTRQPGSFTDSMLKRSRVNDPLHLIRMDFVDLYEKSCNSGANNDRSLPSLQTFRDIRESVFRRYEAVCMLIASNKT